MVEFGIVVGVIALAAVLYKIFSGKKAESQDNGGTAGPKGL